VAALLACLAADGRLVSFADELDDRPNDKRARSADEAVLYCWVDARPRPPGQISCGWCIRSVNPGHGFAGDGFLAVLRPEQGLERSDLAGDRYGGNPFDRLSMVKPLVRSRPAPRPVGEVSWPQFPSCHAAERRCIMFYFSDVPRFSRKRLFPTWRQRSTLGSHPLGRFDQDQHPSTAVSTVFTDIGRWRCSGLHLLTICLTTTGLEGQPGQPRVNGTAAIRFLDHLPQP